MADRNFVGARLRVATSDGNYEGTVHSIDTEKRKLTLTKVVFCNTGSKLHGFHHFFGHELNNLELLDEPNNSGASNQQTEEKKGSSVKEDERLPETNSESSNSHHPRATSQKTDVGFGQGRGRGIRKAFKDAGIGINSKLGVKKVAVSSGSFSRDVSDEGGSLLKRHPIEAEKYLSDMLSDDDEKENMSPDEMPATVVIDAFGKMFEEAVNFISKQRVIGVCCEGVNLGRFGKLCWLVIGCSKVIYLFDVLTLGAPCFDEGLQDILESGDILKVLHDCRQVSDTLFHQYKVRLVNVFDTQVADVIIFKNERAGELPRHVNGLVACLYEYLNLSPEHVNFQKVRLRYMQKKESIWADRPSPAALVDAAAKHVMYLRELRLAQMERMMAEFLYGVDIYLSLVRDAKDVPKVKGQLLPSKFHTLSQFNYRQRSRRYDGDFHEETVNGVPEDVLASREAWSEGQDFAQEYENKKGRVKEKKFLSFNPAPPPADKQIGPTPSPVERQFGAGPSPVDRLRQSLRDSASGSDSEGSIASAEGTGFKPATREQAVKVPSVKTTPVAIPSAATPVFTEQDFPPLSSSESEGPGTPPRSSAMNSAKRNFQTKVRLEKSGAQPPRLREPGQGSNVTGPQGISPQRASELLRESAAFPGRGRAGALLRHAAMPAIRLPAEDSACGGGYSYNPPYVQSAGERHETKGNEFQFPADDELLASPEVIPVPRNNLLFSGGTQVKIRQT